MTVTDHVVPYEVHQVICRDHQQKIADFLMQLADEFHNDALRIAAAHVRFFAPTT